MKWKYLQWVSVANRSWLINRWQIKWLDILYFDSGDINVKWACVSDRRCFKKNKSIFRPGGSFCTWCGLIVMRISVHVVTIIKMIKNAIIIYRPVKIKLWSFLLLMHVSSHCSCIYHPKCRVASRSRAAQAAKAWGREVRRCASIHTNALAHTHRRRGCRAEIERI